MYHTHVSHAQANTISANTTCIWQYILKVHYQSARFFNFAYQPNGLVSLRASSDICRLKLWSYYSRENLCTGPLYDLDLITIGNLNQVKTTSTTTVNSTSTGPTTTSSTTGNNVKPVNDDDVWYPVPIQSAIDYYEQLDPLLPTQYELLLKQLMRMQPPPVSSSATTPLNEPVGWKHVWDCFYDMAESKMMTEIETAAAATAAAASVVSSNQADEIRYVFYKKKY